MGCLTWGYKRMNPQPTDEQLTKKLKDCCIDNYNFCKDIVKNNKHVLDDKYEDTYYPFKSLEHAKTELINYKWAVDNCEHSDDYKVNYENDIKNNVDPLSIEAELYIKKYSPYYEESLIIYDEQTHAFYMETDEGYGNNMFRCYDYSQENLHSREETLALIENNNNTVDEVNIDKINEFWNKYPDGLIDFG